MTAGRFGAAIATDLNNTSGSAEAMTPAQLTPNPLPDEDDAEIAEDLPSAAALDAALPLPWKYELPYHDEPHDAFYIGGRLLWVRHADVEEASARRRQGFDGRAERRRPTAWRRRSARPTWMAKACSSSAPARACPGSPRMHTAPHTLR